MKKSTPISKIMSTDIVTMNQNQTLGDLNQLIEDKHIRHVPIVFGDHVVGMLSTTDLEKISFINTFDGDGLTTSLYGSLTIKQVMTKEVTLVQKNDTIYDVAVILSKNEFHALPVLDGQKIVGIVTTTDLLKYLIEQF
jgi:CBS domain-containing protein